MNFLDTNIFTERKKERERERDRQTQSPESSREGVVGWCDGAG